MRSGAPAGLPHSLVLPATAPLGADRGRHGSLPLPPRARLLARKPAGRTDPGGRKRLGLRPPGAQGETGSGATAGRAFRRGDAVDRPEVSRGGGGARRPGTGDPGAADPVEVFRGVIRTHAPLRPAEAWTGS